MKPDLIIEEELNGLELLCLYQLEREMFFEYNDRPPDRFDMMIWNYELEHLFEYSV